MKLPNITILDEKHKILHQVSKEVSFPVSAEDRKLAEDTIKYLEMSQDDKIAEKYNLRAGMGMAFVQLGHLKRIFVIVYEYEEERCQQVRRVSLVVLTNAAFYDIILDHRDEHLHQADSAFRGLLTGVVFPVPFGGSEHDEQQQSAVDHQAEHILGDGKVPRPYL